MADAPSDDPKIVREKTRASVLGAQTPLKFPSESVHYFTMFKFVTYNRTNPKFPAIKVDQADVILPLPTNLREYYAMMYNDVEFDKFGGVINSVDKVIDQYINNGGNLMEALDAAGTAAAGVDFAQAMSRRTAAYISDDLGGIIDRVQGNVVNPHITSLFRGVGLREHQLSWRLHARNARESREIRSIINYFRQRMHPTKKSDFLLNFPDEVYVKFFAGDKPFLYPIFKAQVTSIDVPHSSDGTNAFYAATDEPGVFDFTVVVKEVEAATRETFDELEGEEIPTNSAEPTTNEAGTETQT